MYFYTASKGSKKLFYKIIIIKNVESSLTNIVYRPKYSKILDFHCNKKETGQHRVTVEILKHETQQLLLKLYPTANRGIFPLKSRELLVWVIVAGLAANFQ